MYNNFYQDPYAMSSAMPNAMPNDDRFLFAPFILGGIAGTALGYGISSSNQNNYYPAYQPYPVYPYPVYPTNNYYY